MSEADRTLRILVIDDDESMRSSFKRMFRKLRYADGRQGYELIDAAAGSEGLEKLGEVDYDCILLDYKMPGGDGIQWLKKILSEYPGQAVVMLTGEGSEKVAVEAMKCGAMDYLVKGSLKVENLEKAVLNAVERVRLKKALESASCIC